MLKDFWNQRFSDQDYAYGKEPNSFFKQELDKLSPGKILLPAEGEGRNAVYAAKNGWEVTAFDLSEAGKEKALKLAENCNVKINYIICSFNDIECYKDEYDAIGLVFVHQPPLLRKEFHQNCLNLLKPGGSIILEGFSKEQLNFNSGGPKDFGMLFSINEIKSDFENVSNLDITKELIRLDEGKFHIGKASVIRAKGIK